MEKVILTFIGRDDWSMPVFKDENGRIFKDLSLGDGQLDLCTASGFDGEPDTPIHYIEKYQNTTFEVVGMENEPTNEERFNYMMLSRLEGDCKYFLGNGNRNLKHLPSESVETHISEMKKLYNYFTDSKKPEWITLSDILDYENQMK